MGKKKKTEDVASPTSSSSPSCPSLSFPSSSYSRSSSSLTAKLNQKFVHLLNSRPAAELKDLAAVEQVGGQPGFIVTVDDFFTERECTAMIALMEQIGLKSADGKDLHPKKNEAFLNRDNLRFSDSHLSNAIFQRLSPFIPAYDFRVPRSLTTHLVLTSLFISRVTGTALCLLSFLYFPQHYYRYQKGHRFDKHVDVSRREGSCDTDVSQWEKRDVASSGGRRNHLLE